VYASMPDVVDHPVGRHDVAQFGIERDRALILTGLLAGLRADELLRANVGDLRRTDDGAVVHVRGKGGRDRRVPVEAALVEVIEDYLDSRCTLLSRTGSLKAASGCG
jgi:integrase/recombinase XerC